MSIMLNKGQRVEVISEGFKEQAGIIHLLFDEPMPSFTGTVTAVSPTVEEFATLDPNFKASVEHGNVSEEDLKETVVYYDDVAGRNFILEQSELKAVFSN